MISVSEYYRSPFIEKSGFILSSAFFQILELHNIKLSAADQAAIKQQCEKNGGYYKYKDVLQLIQMNKEAADPLNVEWLFIKP